MKTVLFSVSYLIEVEDNLLTGSDESEVFKDNVFSKLSKNSWKKIDAKHKANWNSSSFSILDPTRMNCGKCCRCGAWVTDREKSAPVVGLANGATVNGELLCDECLPKGHRWAF